MSDCQCFTGTPYHNKDGSCGCLPIDNTGGIKPIPVMQGFIRPPYNWNSLFQKTSKQPPLSVVAECNIEAPSGFEYIWVNSQCVLHQIGTTRPINAVPVMSAAAATDGAQFDVSEFVQENKLLVLGALAAAAYFIFGKDKPKTREVTSVSKY